MTKNVQDSVKRIIFYFLCGFVIFSILFIITNRKSLLITSPKPDLNYNSGQVRSFSKKTLTTLYQAFPEQTSESKKYQTAKDKDYKSYLLTNALKQHDFHTLIAICKKDSTNLNKAYVYACGWNIGYDETHMTNYAKCLIYYRNHMSKAEKTQISEPLHKMMKACIYETVYSTPHVYPN